MLFRQFPVKISLDITCNVTDNGNIGYRVPRDKLKKVAFSKYFYIIINYYFKACSPEIKAQTSMRFPGQQKGLNTMFLYQNGLRL